MNQKYVLVKDHFDVFNSPKGYISVVAVLNNKSAALPVMMQSAGVRYISDIEKVETAGELAKVIGAEAVKRFVCCKDYNDSDELNDNVFVAIEDDDFTYDVFTLFDVSEADEYGISYVEDNTLIEVDDIVEDDEDSDADAEDDSSDLRSYLDTYSNYKFVCKAIKEDN